MQKLIPPGEKAPDFSLPLQHEEDKDGNLLPTKTFTLSDHKGENIILSFYPADFSGVCGAQNTLYNELVPVFQQYNAKVFGISVDGQFCHGAYKKINNFTMDFISDFEPKGKVAKMFGAYEDTMGVCKRVIYVIDKDGVVRYSYESPMDVNPGAKEILETLKTL